MSPKIERSNCNFAVQQTAEGKTQIVINLFRESIPRLNNTVIGFDLLGGTTVEQARTVVEVLNERVLELFVVSS